MEDSGKSKSTDELGRDPEHTGAVEHTRIQTARYFVFALGDAEYAMTEREVVLVLEKQVPVRIPGTPPSILGVIHTRGKIVTIVDLAGALQLPLVATDDTSDSRIVVVSSNGLTWGFFVTGTSGLIDVPQNEVRSRTESNSISMDSSSSVLGHFELNSSAVVVLDTERLVDHFSGAHGGGVNAIV